MFPWDKERMTSCEMVKSTPGSVELEDYPPGYQEYVTSSALRRR
jgi:hypothetical protein